MKVRNDSNVKSRNFKLYSNLREVGREEMLLPMLLADFQKFSKKILCPGLIPAIVQRQKVNALRIHMYMVCETI